MAPLWGSSWSSTWGSLSGYSQVQGADANGSGSSDLKPSLGQILTSKRIRYTASALAVVGFFFLAFRHSDQLPTLATMRGGSSAVMSTNTDCPPAVVPSFVDASVDWSRYAYTQYVTNKEYLCNSVMIFETLHRLKAKAERVMMYPDNMMSPTETNPLSHQSSPCQFPHLTSLKYVALLRSPSVRRLQPSASRGLLWLPALKRSPVGKTP